MEVVSSLFPSATPDELLSARESARCLGISTATLYDWLAQSNCNTFRIRGRPVTIEYFQGGAEGRGRIKVQRSEIERLKELMRVTPKAVPVRRMPTPQRHYPGIVVPLGKPKD